MVDYQPLGDSGLVVSTVGIGCNAFGTRIDQDTVDDVVDAALDAGVNFFDTADTYGRGLSEEMLGRALQGRRQDVGLATKFGMDMEGANGPDHGARASRRYVRRAVEASLRRLQTDHIDLYQLHQPDLVTPLEETLSALGELVTEGKVRYVGCSNFAAWEVADAHHVARQLNVPGFITAQNEYSLYNRVAEDELLPACRATGLSLLPYFPLAYGLLTGKYKRDQEAPTGSRLSAEGQRRRLQNADFDRIDALQAFADESFGIYHDEIQDVVLRIKPRRAEDALRWRFHATQKVTQEDDGSVLVTFRAGGMRELSWHLFTWGGDIEIVAPQALKDMMVAELQEAGRAHGAW